jgi:hypothetical protein
MYNLSIHMAILPRRGLEYIVAYSSEVCYQRLRFRVPGRKVMAVWNSLCCSLCDEIQRGRFHAHLSANTVCPSLQNGDAHIVESIADAVRDCWPACIYQWCLS